MPNRKLIEVALPLDAINAEAAREKSIRHGHPSTLHLWWARRPLAACRAVLFAQLVDDPSAHPDRFPTEADQARERERLFGIIRELVKWENVTNEAVLEQARAEIRASCDGHPPPVLDPFCGGGSIPLEAQRLGLEAHGSDLNPVAVLITKALIEIPPKFAGRPPVNPAGRRGLSGTGTWKGAQGLAEDVRYYGQWMRDEAETRIGHLYPKVTIPNPQPPTPNPHEATVIAWLWARTVASPNPAVGGALVPLVRSFWLSTKPGRLTWVEPVVDGRTYRFTIRSGTPTPEERKRIESGTKAGRGANFICLLSGTPMPDKYIRAEAQAGRMGVRLMAIVAEGDRQRIYLPPDEDHERIAKSAVPPWKPEEKVTTPCHDVDRLPMYGMYTWGDAFTPRQLVALTTFSDLVGEAMARARADAVAAGLPDDDVPLEAGGVGARGYAEAVGVYLGFGVDKAAEGSTSLCTWSPLPTKLHVVNTFGRQALPMVWDYAEGNLFGDSAGNLARMVELAANVLARQAHGHSSGGCCQQKEATAPHPPGVCLSTDPPYYDNIGYADLSDFFYVWLRRSLGAVYPTLFSTMLTPKAPELIASPYRFDGSKAKAERFFEEGLGQAFARMRQAQHPDFPLTVYYAFKQAERGDQGTASTGWETMLAGLIAAGFTVDGTWPMRTERAGGFRNKDANALASSIVLVCRPRPEDAPITDRRAFLSALKRELPRALRELRSGGIAPVDFAQAAIGPGMAVYSRYAKVLEADGSAMSVRTALALINGTLDEVLAEAEGDLDPDSRWAVAWFEQHGFEEGAYGDAETLCKAKNTSAEGLVEAGILHSRAGKVRLLRRDELGAPPSGWQALGAGKDAGAPSGPPVVWAVTQHLVRALDGGEAAAAALLAKLGGVGETARDLAYRLYGICERKGWAAEALGYNALVTAWSGVRQQAADLPRPAVQGELELE